MGTPGASSTLAARVSILLGPGVAQLASVPSGAISTALGVPFASKAR
jgi:hypothetical protein